MKNAGLEEAQAGIKIAGRNINNLRYADDTTLMAESEEELKSLLVKVKEESEKVVLKLNIQKMIMASGSITSWEIDGETVETVSDFIFLGSKITADGDCSHEIKRCLLLGRKVMTNLDSTFKSRDITLPTKVHLVKALVFPLVLYGCESWTIKKAEHQRIDAFELWCLRRLLRVPWTAGRSNEFILKEISPEYSLEELMLKLKLQYFSYLMWRTAAAAAKTLQSCPTLCDPIDSSPPGSTIPGILQARTLEWVAISFSNAWKWKVKLKVKSLSRVWLLATPWTGAYQAPPSMGFSRQEYWTGLPFPFPCYWIILVFCPFGLYRL